MERGNRSLFFSFFLLDKHTFLSNTLAMATQKEPKQIEPLEEPQEQTVSVKLGKTHFEALLKWSKDRFGLANQAGMVRLLVHEKWQTENNGDAKP